MQRSTWGAIYKELGARPVINAMGHVTLLGGSSPSPTVRQAMERANEAYIPLAELQEKAGQAIAEMLRVEAAYVTSGAASALVLAAAACMAGDDDAKIQQLPDTTGMKNEFLIQKKQRYWYDRCISIAGGKPVEVGDDNGTTEAQFKAAIGPKTAGVWFFAPGGEPGTLPFEKVLSIAKAHKLPVVVDAAGQVYPPDNLSKYARMGADLVAYGAKYILAPHSTGLLVGSKEMVRKAALHSFVSYEARRVRSLGRAMKIDRQEIVGAVAALKEWLTMNHEDRIAKLDARIDTISRAVSKVKGVKVTPQRDRVPSYGMRIDWDPAQVKKSAAQVVEELKQGEPPIWVRLSDPGILVAVVCLNEGEDAIVGERLAKALKG